MGADRKSQEQGWSVAFRFFALRPKPLGFALGKAIILSSGKGAWPEFLVVQNSHVLAGLTNDKQATPVGETIRAFVDAHAGDAGIQDRPFEAWKEMKKPWQPFLQELFDVALSQYFAGAR